MYEIALGIACALGVVLTGEPWVLYYREGRDRTWTALFIAAFFSVVGLVITLVLWYAMLALSEAKSSGATYEEVLRNLPLKEASVSSEPKVQGGSEIAVVEFAESGETRSALVFAGKGVRKGDSVEVAKVMLRSRNGTGTVIWEPVYVVTGVSR